MSLAHISAATTINSLLNSFISKNTNVYSYTTYSITNKFSICFYHTWILDEFKFLLQLNSSPIMEHSFWCTQNQFKYLIKSIWLIKIWNKKNIVKSIQICFKKNEKKTSRTWNINWINSALFLSSKHRHRLIEQQL